MGKKVKFDKLSREEQLIVFHANDVLWLWRELIRQDTEGRGWHEHRARQAYQDCMQSLQHNGLIESYDCDKVRTKIQGEWYSDRRTLDFVQTGPEVDVL
jgi:hypothetical protein